MGWEKGFFEVDLSKVKTPELDPNWEQSPKSYSRQQIDGWTRQLGEIQRLSVERGYAYEDFQRMRNSQLPAERELGETHHKFYDHDHRDFVSLVWKGKQYEVDVNGHHRVHSAQEMGLRRMPAQISALSEHMVQCKRQGYTSSLMHPGDRVEFARSQGQTPQQPSMNTATPADSTPSRTDAAQPAKAQPQRVSR